MGTVPGVARKDFAELRGSSAASYRDQILQRLHDLAGLGVTTTGVPLAITRSAQEFVEYLQWFDEEVAAQVNR